MKGVAEAPEIVRALAAGEEPSSVEEAVAQVVMGVLLRASG